MWKINFLFIILVQPALAIDFPEHWPLNLWKVCWNQNEGIIDFTTVAWCNLSTKKQIKYSHSYQKWYCKQKQLPQTMTVNEQNIAFEMILIPPGKFWLGKSLDDPYGIGKDRHKVTMKKPYYIGKFEVTKKQWQKGMKNKKTTRKEEKLPATNMNWFECQAFCKKMNMRLPLQKEWEYACRAGTTSRFNLGSHVNIKQINYIGYYYYPKTKREIFFGQTVKVGSLPNQNAWGGYNFHGNVFEWCQDNFSKNQRVSCGGSWRSPGEDCTSSSYGGFDVGKRLSDLGFRVVKDIDK